MIYILDVDTSFNMQKHIFDILDIDYKLLEISYSSLDEFINSKTYNAILFGTSYRTYLKNKYNTEYKNNNGIDLLIKDDNNLIFDNSLYKGIENLFFNKNFDLNDKSVLLLGSSYTSNIVYEAIKNNYNPKVYIASITEEKIDRLRAGDIRIKKVEIGNIDRVNLIINTTELGNQYQEDYLMLVEDEVPLADTVMDLVEFPVKTAFIRKYENIGASSYDGLLILIYQTIYAISKIKNDYSYFDKIDEIYSELKEKFNDIKNTNEG